MKSILLQIEDNTYQIILEFIKLIPENRCRILEPDNVLSVQENQHIQKCITQIEQGNYSEFEDWETVKNQL